MIKALTDTQRVVLALAAARADRRILPTPNTLDKNSGALSRSLRSLLSQGLIAEISAAPDDVAWTTGDGEMPTTLAISDAGLIAIGIAPDEDHDASTLVPAPTTPARPRQDPSWRSLLITSHA
jgi:hypothetical protein